MIEVAAGSKAAGRALACQDVARKGVVVVSSRVVVLIEVAAGNKAYQRSPGTGWVGAGVASRREHDVVGLCACRRNRLKAVARGETKLRAHC